MKPTTRRQLSLALADLVEGTRNWRPWYVLGLSEVLQRYRRSMLGPFWVTISMGIQATVMGFVLAFLFNIEVKRFLPFLCVSLMTWNFLVTTINEGATCFSGLSTVILQVKRPLWTYVMLTLWRNTIIYAHTAVVFFIAAISFGIVPTAKYLLIPVGLVLFVANVGWMALAAGLVSTRFRDVPLIIQNAFNILLWLTPVYYHPSQLSPNMRFITDINPLTYVIEVARAPFLNEVPALSVWLIALGLTIFGWGMTFALFVRTRARVPYWL